MTAWLIIRSEYHKEAAVAVQISKKGFPVWVPMQIISKRPTAARTHMDRSNTVLTKERPVCPSLLFAAVPVGDVDRILGIRHLDRVEQTFEGTWATVPDAEIARFKAAIDAENLATQMLTAAAQRKKRKRWVTLQEAFEDLVAVVKGPMEQAA
jgi:hypothetical protein